MITVTCKYCKSKIDKQSAYCVRDKNGRNTYYCSEQEYNSAQKVSADRKALLAELTGIFGYEVYKNSLFMKMLGGLLANHPVEMILLYIRQNNAFLQSIADKGFQSEYHRINYFMAVLRNNLAGFTPKEDVILQSSYEMFQTNWAAKPRRPTVDDWEDAYLLGDDDVI